MTPLERTARALRDAAKPASLIPWADLTGDTKAQYIAQARSVIEAIREPSEAMVGAAYCDLNLSREDADAPDVEITRAWHSMIDALLQENPQA